MQQESLHKSEPSSLKYRITTRAWFTKAIQTSMQQETWLSLHEP